MSQSVLGIVTAACNELGYDAPETLIANDDPDATQLLSLVQAVGEDLLAAGDWSFLVIEGATIALQSGVESYALPNDFDRLVADTQWDRTNRWRTFGPDNAQEARWRREGVNSQIGPRRALRQVGAKLTCWPVPAETGDIIAYDYVSNAWVSSAAGASQSAFLADTDITLYRPRLMIQGLKWMWMAAKGMETMALEQNYEIEKKKALARDMGGGRTLNMAGSRNEERGNADDVVASSPVVILGTTGGTGLGID